MVIDALTSVDSAVLDAMIDEEKRNDLAWSGIKDILYLCSNCLYYSQKQTEVIPICAGCFRCENSLKELYELIYDSVYYGWLYRTILEEQMKFKRRANLHAIIHQPDPELLAFATYVIMIKCGLIDSKRFNMSKIIEVMERFDPEHNSSAWQVINSQCVTKFQEYLNHEFIRLGGGRFVQQ